MTYDTCHMTVLNATDTTMSNKTFAFPKLCEVRHCDGYTNIDQVHVYLDFLTSALRCFLKQNLCQTFGLNTSISYV